MINFEVTKEDAQLINKIVRRAVASATQDGIEMDQMAMHMDITACHANGCPLDLRKFHAAPDFDFEHDIYGIRRHIDRKTGRLGGCFLPRCAAAEPQPA